MPSSCPFLANSRTSNAAAAGGRMCSAVGGGQAGRGIAVMHSAQYKVCKIGQQNLGGCQTRLAGCPSHHAGVDLLASVIFHPQTHEAHTSAHRSVLEAVFLAFLEIFLVFSFVGLVAHATASFHRTPRFRSSSACSDCWSATWPGAVRWK